MKKAATIIFDKGAQHVIIKGGKALHQINRMTYTMMVKHFIN